MRIVVAKIEFIILSDSTCALEYCKANFRTYTEYDGAPEHTIKIKVDVEDDFVCLLDFSPKLGWEMNKNGYVLSVNSGNSQKLLRAYIDLDFSECVIEMQNASIEVLGLAISVLWRIISARYSAILLHASAFVHRGMGCVCCAHSGGGKSTFLDMMKMPALTDEMSCIVTEKSLGIPKYQTIPWRDLLGSNLSYPLGIICILNKSRETYIREVPKDVAEILLKKFLYFNFWINGSKDRANREIGKIVKKVPVVECGFSLITSPQDVLMLIDNAMNDFVIDEGANVDEI